jgi:hypothetical protein
MDKTEFGPGPWQDEPDRVEFEHAGLPCLMKRNYYGVWCGYAAVPPGHPLHGKAADDPDVHVVSASVHGGLTWASACQGSICHVPKPGEPDDVWWFGFDCGHCDDLSPLTEAKLPDLCTGGTYRDQAYVTAEVRGLAEQLAGVDRARD